MQITGNSVRRSGYPQTLKHRPADAVSTLTVRMMGRRACIQTVLVGVELDHEFDSYCGWGSAEVSPTLVSLLGLNLARSRLVGKVRV